MHNLTRFVTSAASISALVLATTAVPGASGRAAGASLPAAGAGWRVVYRASSSHPNWLLSVTPAGTGEAWATGTTALTGGTEFLLRWDGGRWRRVPAPGMSGMDVAVVRASSRRNVWLYGASDSRPAEVIKRWDGSRWHSVPLPSANRTVTDLVVLSRSDVWGLGPRSCIHNLRHCTTSLYRWNGRGWSHFTVPTFVHAISGSPAGSVWAVGQYGGDFSPPQQPGRPVSYRWNGKAWHAVTSMPRPLSYFPADIAVASRKSVWVQAVLAGKSGPGRGYLLHWNGSHWRRIIAPARVHGLLVPDGRRGVWDGPDAHWTGWRWVNTTPGRSFAGGKFWAFSDMVRIPGTPKLWGAGLVAPSRTSRARNSLIAIHGKAP